MTVVFARILLRLLAFALRQRGNRKAALPLHPNSILFVEMTRFGDIVAMLPVLQSFHEAFPRAKISVACQPQFVPLLASQPWIFAISGLENTQSISGLAKAAREVRKNDFDLICSMSPALRNAFLTLSTPSPVKIGYFEGSDSLTPFMERAVVSGIGVELAPVTPYDHENIYVRAQKIATGLGVPLRDSFRWDFGSAASTMSEEPLIVLHPFAGWSFREWKIERYRALARELRSAYGARVLLSGTPGELERAGIASLNEGGVTAYAITDLVAYTRVLSQAALFIGNDSGPLHLAASVGIPCIGLFGPATPALTAPLTPNVTSVYHKMECSPCLQETCIHPDRPCMDLIDQAEVMRLVRSGLHREMAGHA